MDFVADCVTQAKRRYDDPFIFVAGDFNQWRIDEILADFIDVREIEVGPTRGDRLIDRIFSNSGRAVVESGSLPPLETDDPQARKSDHRIAYITAALPTRVAFKWLEYSYRYYNRESADLFGEWLGSMSWDDLMMAEDSNAKANIYQEEVVRALESCLLYTSPSPRD